MKDTIEPTCVRIHPRDVPQGSTLSIISFSVVRKTCAVIIVNGLRKRPKIFVPVQAPPFPFPMMEFESIIYICRFEQDTLPFSPPHQMHPLLSPQELLTETLPTACDSFCNPITLIPR